ncbi:branched-chain amino acid ABC transporter permease [Paenibacillus chungangensis]|uniref:Branched-chain amino acid ABC transporter permease n=1 Tax=Paenibacillus chungangensis TaxID=696535 RepID=A0ABW3HQP4_9BACL
MSEFSQLLLNGIVIGSFYVLIALGLSIIFGILDISHFAHGSVAMFSGYVGYMLATKLNAGFIVSLLLSMVFAAVMGVVLEKVAYSPVKNAPPINGFIIALALMMIIDNIAVLIFGANQVVIPTGIDGVVRFGDVAISSLRLYLLGTSFLLILLLYLFMKYTKTGKAIRAVAQNREAARIVGINTNRISSIVFALGSAMAGAAGVFIGSIFALYPAMGGHTVMKGFAVLILGGLGSFPGAIVGGMLIGVTENFGTAFVSSSYKDLFAFVILIAVLIFKPKGLFGNRGL